MKKMVGIIMRPDKNLTNKNVYIVGSVLRDIILKNDLIPIGILPNIKNINNKLNNKEINEMYNILSMCSGIILQGGDNYYDYDKTIIKYAIKNNIPILGICLGMQAMASIDNDNLVSIDLKKYDNHNQNLKYVHNIVIDKNSKLYDILKKDSIKVNSTHNECITNPGKYTVSAYSNDGIIEAIEYNINDFNIGLQFHPERLYDDKNIYKIFKAFFGTIKRD